MPKNSIAQSVYTLNRPTPAQRALGISAIALPEGVVGKMFTTYSNGLPDQSALVFADGSELTIGRDGTIGWTPEKVWSGESIVMPKLASQDS